MSATDEQKNAAERIIYYFLSEAAQEELTINNSDCLPFNKNVLQLFIDINPDFSFLTGDITKYKVK